MANRELRILASEIIPSNEKIKYYTINFPNEWLKLLTDIYKVIKSRDKVRLPVDSLKEALQALPLNIIDINPVYYNCKQDYRPWIISTESIDVKIIIKIIKSWCSIEFISKENIESDLIEKISEILDNFKDEEIVIEEKFLDMSETRVLENGTANPDLVIYKLLGSYVAQKITEDKETIIIGDEVFNFVRDKNKLISIPVKEYRNCYYSINITFEVKTIAGYSKPILLIDTGISRWANGKLAKTIGYKDKTSVFIKYNDSKNKFNSITLGCDAIKKKYKEDCYIWANNVKEILEDSTLAYLPELSEVLEKSVDYIGNNKKYTMFIAYNNRNKGNHFVKKGMSMHEKYEVYKQITKRFEFLQPIGNNEYRKVKRRYSGSDLIKSTITKCLDEFARREKELNLEIVYINKNTPSIITKYFLDSIGKSEYFNEFDNKKCVKVDYNGLTLNIKAIMSGNIVEPMIEFKSKVNEVIEALPKKEGKTITVVEIYDKSHYKNNDPKFAIRKGLYLSNRFNQFISSDNITLLDEENPKRLEKNIVKVKSIIENVLFELMRQLGIMHSDISLTGLKGIPDNFEIIGFNLLSTNYNKKYDILSFPIAVSIRTGKKDIYVKTPVNDWLEYSEAILYLGKNNEAKKKYDEVQINKFFRSILNDANENNSLVLVDTSNKLNLILIDFQDKKLNFSERFEEFRNVRIIRVKSNGEVPKVVGINKNDEAYFTEGIKQIVDNVYYSMEGRGTTYRNIWQDHRKLSTPNKEFKISPVLEIVPVKLNIEDNSDSFVYFTHRLRKLNITYDEYSAVPMVNHLAKSFQEVLLVKDVTEDE